MTNHLDLLDQLLSAVAPHVEAAARDLSARPAMTIARLYPSPFRVDVVYHDAAGAARMLRAEVVV